MSNKNLFTINCISKNIFDIINCISNNIFKIGFDLSFLLY